MFGKHRIARIAALAIASQASATWSILLIDVSTGEMGIASATCLTNFDLQANASVVVVGKGVAAAQSSVDTTGLNRMLIRDRLAAGVSPQDILAELSVFDGNHESRQYGIVDTQGRGITFTGQEDGQWAGGITGALDYSYAGKPGRIVYAIQGNVLTGQPVIDAALTAARTTNGDLPARLMAAMEAARLFGGDGRCSCTTSGPEGCGSPPPSFTKSADIGYMVVSRLGDSDAGSLSLPAGGSGLTTASDITGDGRPDLIVPDASTGSASRFFVFPNATPPGLVTPVFGDRREYPCVLNALATAAGDFTRDGRVDVAVGGGSTATGAAGAVTLYRGRADGTLEGRVDIASPRRVVGVAFADLDGANGPDLVYLTASGLYVRMNDGLGNLGPQVLVASLTSAGSLVVADIAGDGLPDLIVGSGASSLRYFINLGGGAFSTQQSFTLPASARGCAAGDFDGDGDTDLAVAVSSTTAPVRIVLRTPGGLVAGQSITVGSSATSLCTGDTNADGRLDLSFFDFNLRIATALGNGDGTFTLGPRGGTFITSGVLSLADLNGDAFAESLFATGTTLTVSSNSRGTLINQAGFAPGNYFLGINIANQARTDPDPVFQLRAAFDDVRARLVNTPDAVQSIVRYTSTASLGKPQVVTIELRDWRGLPLTQPPRSITVAREGSGPFATAGSTLVPVGIGRYTLTLTPIGYGADRLRIVADGGQRPVTLMPMPVVLVAPPSAPAVR